MDLLTARDRDALVLRVERRRWRRGLLTEDAARLSAARHIGPRRDLDAVLEPQQAWVLEEREDVLHAC